MKITDVAIRRPIFTTMVMMAIVVFGLLGLNRIGVDLLPKVEFPVLVVSCDFSKGDPETIEQNVAIPLEDILSEVSGIRNLRSYSFEGRCQVVLEFELGKDIKDLMQQVLAKVEQVRKVLPKEVEDVSVLRVNPDEDPVMTLAVYSDLPIRDITHIADKVIKERLQQVSGVGLVDVFGGRKEKIWVELDPIALQAHDLTASEVLFKLQQEHLNMPGGVLKSEVLDLGVKVEGEFHQIEAIRELPVAYRNDKPIVLSQIASLYEGLEDEDSLSFLGEKQNILIQITKQSGANTVALATSLKKVLTSIEKTLQKEGIYFKIVQDASIYINRAIHEIQFDLVVGGLLAVVIVFLFLRDLRITLISALAIPISVISSFIFMENFGFTVNMMTCLALSLSIGILIDDAIVVVENIFRHFAGGKTKEEAAREGTQEIAMAAFAITLSIVSVFLPVAYMEGIVGQFFFEFGITVVVAVSMSLFVALTLIPMLASKWLKRPDAKKEVKLLKQLDRLYGRLLATCLTYRKTTLLIACLSLVGSFYLTSFVQKEFVAAEDRSEFQIAIEMPAGTPKEVTQKEILKLVDHLQAASWLDYTYYRVGTDFAKSGHKGQLVVKMVNKKQRHLSQQEVMMWARESLAALTEGALSVGEVSPSSAGGEIRGMLQFEMSGSDPEVLEGLASKVIGYLESDPFYVEIGSSMKEGKPAVSMFIDRQLAASLQVTVEAVANTLHMFVSGVDAIQLKKGGDRIPVTLRLPLEERQKVSDLSALTVKSATGKFYPLSLFIRTEESHAPTLIQRHNRMKVIDVHANFANQDKSLGTVVDELSAYVDTLELPPGYELNFTGHAEMMGDSFANLVFSLGLAVLAIYMVLASQFNSFSQPLIIMLSLPFSFIGAFLFLALFNSTLSIHTMIGMIMLMGLVTKNAILLVDYSNTLLAKGLPLKEALVESGTTRLHPILMTTLAMVFGMLPIAMGTGDGSEASAPMALAIIGGLLTSMFLTLLVVPVAFSLFKEGIRLPFLKKRLIKSVTS